MSNSASQISLTTTSLTQFPTKLAILCTLCSKTYKHCVCKKCSVCQTTFAKLKIGVRSHCRFCNGPICKSCVAPHGSLEKICLICKETEEQKNETTREALRDITKLKHGIDVPLQFDSPKSSGFSEELLGAAKRGDHHILVTLLQKGVNPNLTDSDKNTGLILAAKNGQYPALLLLLEHKASANLANNLGWTPLHAIAWKGESNEHLECADILVRIGNADPIAKTKSNETPYQLAVRMGLKNETLLKFFREQELKCYRSMLANVIEKDTNPSVRIDEIKRPIAFVLEQLEDLMIENDQQLPNANACLPVLDRSVSTLSSYASNLSDSDSDVQSDERFRRFQKDNQKLMFSLSTKVGEIDRIKQKLRKQEEMHLLDVQRLKTAQENQIAKLRSDCEAIIHQYKQQTEEKQAAFDDLQFSLNKHKLVWVHDSLVTQCMNSKCLSQFDNKNRKHHCRCCGRIYCQACSNNQAPIECIGYLKPVRVCKTCFALLEVIFIDISSSENKITMDAVSLYNSNGKNSPTEFSSNSHHTQENLL